MRMSLRAFCLAESGYTNPPIGEALATSGSEQQGVAGVVVKAELGAAVVPKTDLGEVAVKMSFAAASGR